jgi:hypothetical protein
MTKPARRSREGRGREIGRLRRSNTAVSCKGRTAQLQEEIPTAWLPDVSRKVVRDGRGGLGRRWRGRRGEERRDVQQEEADEKKDDRKGELSEE